MDPTFQKKKSTNPPKRHGIQAQKKLQAAAVAVQRARARRVAHRLTPVARRHEPPRALSCRRPPTLICIIALSFRLYIIAPVLSLWHAAQPGAISSVLQSFSFSLSQPLSLVPCIYYYIIPVMKEFIFISGIIDKCPSVFFGPPPPERLFLFFFFLSSEMCVMLRI